MSSPRGPRSPRTTRLLELWDAGERNISRLARIVGVRQQTAFNAVCRHRARPVYVRQAKTDPKPVAEARVYATMCDEAPGAKLVTPVELGALAARGVLWAGLVGTRWGLREAVAALAALKQASNGHATKLGLLLGEGWSVADVPGEWHSYVVEEVQPWVASGGRLPRSRR